MRSGGYFVYLTITILLTLGGIATLIPIAAGKECMFGYTAVCSFAPVSTLLCFIGAGVVCKMRKKKFLS